MWSNVTIKLEYADSSTEPVHARVAEHRSRQVVMECMGWHFSTAYAAKEAYEAYEAGEPDGDRWAEFKAHIEAMYQRHMRMGVEHPRMVSVDFKEVQWAPKVRRDNDWEL